MVMAKIIHAAWDCFKYFAHLETHRNSENYENYYHKNKGE